MSVSDIIKAVDAGYGYTKAEPGGVIFPSTVGHGRNFNLKNEKSKNNTIIINGTKYFVGDLALKESYDASIVFTENKTNHENTIVLILTAIMKSIESQNIFPDNFIHINLITGLPVMHIKQK